MLLYKEELLFIHIPKCAGRSVERYFEYKGRRHRTLDEYIKKEGERIESFFKFSFVRNPWDRMVSWYFAHKGQGYEPKTREGFQDWIKGGLINHWTDKTIDDVNWKNKDPLSMTEFLVTDKSVEFDYIGKVENLEEDLKKICSMKGIRSRAEILNIGKTKREEYKYYYNDECANIVKERFAEDLYNFDYKF